MAKCILVLFALIAVTVGQSHDWYQGSSKPGDYLLYHEIVRKSSSLMQIVTKDIKYPPKGQVRLETINYIVAKDQYINGDGGYVTLYDGGVGYRNVTLHFKSQRGHGFNFILDIYGQ